MDIPILITQTDIHKDTHTHIYIYIYILPIKVMFSFSWIVVLELGPKVVTTTSTMAYDVVFANIHEENYVLQAVVCWENTGTSLAVLHVNRNPSALAPKSAGLEFLPMNCPELPKLLDSHVMSPCLLANSTFWLKSRCVIMPCFFR